MRQMNVLRSKHKIQIQSKNTTQNCACNTNIEFKTRFNLNLLEILICVRCMDVLFVFLCLCMCEYATSASVYAEKSIERLKCNLFFVFHSMVAGDFISWLCAIGSKRPMPMTHQLRHTTLHAVDFFKVESANHKCTHKIRIRMKQRWDYAASVVNYPDWTNRAQTRYRL